MVISRSVIMFKVQCKKTLTENVSLFITILSKGKEAEMLYIALKIAREILKESRRHRKKKKPAERYRCSAGASTVVFITTSGSNGSWTNARG